jgi:hypothetical protein
MQSAGDQRTILATEIILSTWFSVKANCVNICLNAFVFVCSYLATEEEEQEHAMQLEGDLKKERLRW